MSLDDSAALAIAAINLKAEQSDGIKNIRMARITSEKKVFEKISDEDLKKYAQVADQKFKLDSQNQN